MRAIVLTHSRSPRPRLPTYACRPFPPHPPAQNTIPGGPPRPNWCSGIHTKRRSSIPQLVKRHTWRSSYPAQTEHYVPQSLCAVRLFLLEHIDGDLEVCGTKCKLRTAFTELLVHKKAYLSSGAIPPHEIRSHKDLRVASIAVCTNASPTEREKCIWP